MISVYVGNLPYDTTEEQVVELFKQFGEVNRAALVKDRETGRPRGFGFVEMPNDDEARKAIEELSGKDYEGRPLTVNEARNRSAQRNSANLSRSAHKEEPQNDTPSDQSEAESAAAVTATRWARTNRPAQSARTKQSTTQSHAAHPV